MADDVHANLDELGRLSAEVAAAGDTMAGGQTTAGSVDPVEGATFGNTPGAIACYSAFCDAKETAKTAYDNLVSALAADTARLDQVITLFQQTDEATADSMVAAGPQSLTVMSGHVHSGNKLADDYLRGEQLRTMAGHASTVTGPALLGFDGNENTGANFGSLREDTRTGLPAGATDDDNYSARALTGFGEIGYTDLAPTGATSNDGEGQQIDHIRASGLAGTNARVVDGGPSDHQGQTVDVTVAEW
ncbi:hypothetical protein [Virgisporangium aurantiacum]|nr:hypothetical protein [Virgisporangium aurantiacum]